MFYTLFDLLLPLNLHFTCTIIRYMLTMITTNKKVFQNKLQTEAAPGKQLLIC